MNDACLLTARSLLRCPPAAAPAGARWARRCCPRSGERRQQQRLPGGPRGGWTQSFGSKVNKALVLNRLAANPTYFWSSLSLNILRVCSGSEVSTESGAVGEVSSFISLFYNLLLQIQGRQIDGITTVWWCHSCRSVWSVRVWCGFVFTHWLFFLLK